MSLNAALRLLAGTVILLSLLLGSLTTSNWYFLTGLAGVNLLQSAFTNWCPAMSVFKKLGLKAECADQPGFTVNQGLHLLAGSLVLGSVTAVLLFPLSPQLLWIPAIMGLSLVQSAFTGWCPGMTLVRKLGCKSTYPAQ